MEDLADLGAADKVLLDLRRQHPLESGLHVVKDLIDHAVCADIDAFFLGQLLGLVIGLDVETDDDGIGGGRQDHVRRIDRPHALMHNADLDLRRPDLVQRILNGLQGPLDIRF